jgi:starch phosphorylase
MAGQRESRGGKAPGRARLRADLEGLSRNLRWTWDPEAQELVARLARAAGDPSPHASLPQLLQRLSGARLDALAQDPGYARLHARVLRRLKTELRPPRAAAGLSWQAPVAYFSMEFGIHESLPIYAGGLGILAGDHVKAAHDEGVPLAGVGLFYHSGYFRQELDLAGRQNVVYPRARLADLPLEAARDARGRELRIAVEFPDREIRLKVWRAQAGRVAVHLLDADVPENRPEDRGITNKLYGGSREDRIRQEVAAGIGGVRALRALGIEPGVWHLNEGHVAFLTLERLRDARRRLGLSFHEAIEAVAADTVFTTHTPVPEGNEVFDLGLARRYLARHAEAAGIPIDDYLTLGLDKDAAGRPVLSMTVLALRFSRFRNGVSKLHGQVSRKMWARLWPGFRPEETPIGSVTNGVHMPTWVAPAMDRLLVRRLGDWRRHQDDSRFWRRASRLGDAELWEAKGALKAELVSAVRAAEDARLARLGVKPAERRAHTEDLLDPEALTIGFARRFALYKRSALLFHDLDRARRLFASRSRPLQIIFAGKPHPEDPRGKEVFEEIAALARRKEFAGKVVLLENYGIDLARKLVQGVDVWLNNPRRPLEASGTSGQKVPINAGLNLSILDGWWDEGYTPGVGWAFGKALDYADPRLQDEADAEALHRALERQVIPLYYRRDRRGIPAGWLRMVKRALAALVPRFSASHMVREYARDLYRPAYRNGRRLHAARGRGARELARWREEVARGWPLVHVRSVKRAVRGGLEVELSLGSLRPGHIACLGAGGEDLEIRQAGTVEPGIHRFLIAVPRSAAGSQAGARRLRLYPRHPLLTHRGEMGLVLEAAW